MAALNQSFDDDEIGIDEEPARLNVTDSMNFKDKMIRLSKKTTLSVAKKVQESWIDNLNSFCLSHRSKKTYSFTDECSKL